MKENKYDYKNILIFSGVIFFFTIALTIFAWGKIPNDTQVPVHWNIQGEVDRYGSKTTGLLTGPGTVLFLTLLLTYVPRMDPRKGNIMQSQKPYKTLIVGILIFVAGLHLITILTVLGYELNMITMMAFLMGVLFMVIGNYLGKVRSNFMFGIRTPWTLSSEESWNKTHRLGGWVFFVTGLLILLNGIFNGSGWVFVTLLGGFFLAILFLFGYSYWVWKKDETVSHETNSKKK